MLRVQVVRRALLVSAVERLLFLTVSCSVVTAVFDMCSVWVVSVGSYGNLTCCRLSVDSLLLSMWVIQFGLRMWRRLLRAVGGVLLILTLRLAVVVVMCLRSCWHPVTGK